MPTATFPNLIPALPELFVAVLGMALLMLGVFQKAEGKGGAAKAARLVSSLTLLVLLLAAALVVNQLVVAGHQARILTFGGLFVADTFGAYFKILILIGSALSIVLAQDYLERQGIARFEYAIVILFATLGMMLMVSANNLMSLYLGLELQSLALYVAASFQRDSVRSTEAGLKYFVLGALASGMLLYGASLVYGFTGTVDFDSLAALFHEGGGHVSSGLVVGLVFVMVGLAFKVSAVPFHMWTPDVYEGAPTPVTAFFSVAPKMAAIALFVRVMVEPFGDLADQWRQIVVLIAIASMILGAFAAINQRNIKRMMAYSSIGHVGYALIGLAAGGELGVRAILVYMTIYLFMNLGTFAAILCMKRNERMVETLDDLAGLSKTHPMVALALAIFMFSMSGIPPLAGFFGKLYIFLAAVEAELWTLAVLGVLSSVVAAFYYLRIVKIMYFDEVGEPLDRPVARPIAAVLALSGVLVLLFFLMAGPVLNGAEAAAASLFAG